MNGEVKFRIVPEQDPDWKCYLFGNTPSGHGMVYFPSKGQVPNWFVRWMMKVCLGCTWVKKEQTK
jgi:hypothetical protein